MIADLRPEPLIASLLARRRHGDDAGFVARYGGEEFAILFEGAGATLAAAAVGDVVFHLEAASIPHKGLTLGRVSLSALTARSKISGAARLRLDGSEHRFAIIAAYAETTRNRIT